MKYKNQTQKDMLISFLKSCYQFNNSTDFLRTGNKEVIILTDLDIGFEFINGEYNNSFKVSENNVVQKYYTKKESNKNSFSKVDDTEAKHL